MQLPFGERERGESKTKYAENPFPNARAWKDSGLQKSTPLPGPNPVVDAFVTALLFKKENQCQAGIHSFLSGPPKCHSSNNQENPWWMAFFPSIEQKRFPLRAIYSSAKQKGLCQVIPHNYQHSNYKWCPLLATIALGSHHVPSLTGCAFSVPFATNHE